MEKIFLGDRQTEDHFFILLQQELYEPLDNFFIKLGQEDKENAIFNKSGGKICRGCWSSYDRFSKLQEKIEEKLLHTLAEEQGQEQVATSEHADLGQRKRATSSLLRTPTRAKRFRHSSTTGVTSPSVSVRFYVYFSFRDRS